MRRLGRALWLTFASLLGLLLTLLVLVGVALAWSSTPRGNAWIQDKLLVLARENIPGRVTLETFTFRWWERLELGRFSLATPEGEPVVAFDNFRLEYDLEALRRGRLQIPVVSLTRPDIHLHTDSAGISSLDKALGSADDTPAPEDDSAPWDGTLPLEISLQRIEIKEGSIEMRDDREQVPVSLASTGLSLEAAYQYQNGWHSLSLPLFQASMTAPGVGPSTANLELAYRIDEGEPLLVVQDANVDANGLHLSASAFLGGVKQPSGWARLELSQLSPAFAHLFTDAVALEGDVSMYVEANREAQEQLEVNASLFLPRGDATLTGSLDVASVFPGAGDENADKTYDFEALAYDLQLKLQALDVFSLLPARSRPAAQLTPLSLTLDIRGSGISPETLDANLSLDLAELRYDKWQVRSSQVEGRVHNNTLTLQHSQFDTPYAQLSALGDIGLDGQLKVQATALIEDLGPLGEALELPTQGKVQAKANVTGSLENILVGYQFAAAPLSYGPAKDPTVKVERVGGSGQVRLTESPTGETDTSVTLEADGQQLGSSSPLVGPFHLKTLYYGDGADITLTGADLRSNPLSIDLSIALADPKVMTVRQMTLPLGTSPWELEAPFKVLLAPDRTEISPMALKSPHGSLTAGGTYRPRGANDLNLELKGLQLAALAPLLSESSRGIRGSIDLTAHVTGESDNPSLDSRLSLREVTDGTPLTVTGTLALASGAARNHRMGAQPLSTPGATLTTDLTLKNPKAVPSPGQDSPSPTGKISGALELPVHITLAGAPTLTRSAPMEGSLQFIDLDLATLAEVGDAKQEALSGKLQGVLTLNGNIEAPQIELSLKSERMTVVNENALNLSMVMGYRDGRFKLSGAMENPTWKPKPLPQYTYDAKGKPVPQPPIEPDPEALAKTRTFFHADMNVPVTLKPDFSLVVGWQEPVDARLYLGAPELRLLAPLMAGAEELEGQAALDMRASGNLEDPEFRSELRVRELKDRTSPGMDVDIEASYLQGRAAILTRAQTLGEPPILAEARLKLPFGALMRGEKAALSDLKAALEVPSLNLMALPEVLRGQQLKGGVLAVHARVDSPGATPTGQIAASLKDLRVTGTKPHDISLVTRYDGALAVVNALVTTDEDAETTDGKEQPEATSKAGDAREPARSDKADDDDDDAGHGKVKEAYIRGRTPLVVQLPLDHHEYKLTYGAGLNLTIDMPGLDLRILNAFLPGGSSVEGQLRGRVTASGALNAPRVEGALSLPDGRFSDPANGLNYDNIVLASRFTNDELFLEKSSMRGGKGQATLEGSIKMVNQVPKDLDFKMKFDRFEALNGPPGQAIVNGQLQIAGTTSSPLVTGSLTIPDAVVMIPDLTGKVVKEVSGLESDVELAPVSLPPSVVVQGPKGVISMKEFDTGVQEEEDDSSSTRLDIQVHMPRNVWVQNQAGEVNIELKGDVRYQSDASGETLQGTVETVRGEIRLFSQPLTIEEGLIIFTGNRGLNPRLDITASSTLSRYGTVTVKVLGTANKPELVFSSDQGYETADILALLTIGKPLSEGSDPNASNDMMSQLEALAAGTLAGVARKQILTRLPVRLDVLTVESTGFSSANLRVGKYVTPKLFLVVKQKIAQTAGTVENNTEVRAEYQLTPAFYLEVFYGDANIWGGQGFWKKTY